MKRAKAENTRFSKATLARYCLARLQQIQRVWGFDPGNGTAQLDKFKGDALMRASLAYGEKEALNDLMSEFGLWETV